MNCFNHPERPAVIQCKECLKGFCEECSDQIKDGVCSGCRNKKAGRTSGKRFDLMDPSYDYGKDMKVMAVSAAVCLVVCLFIKDCDIAISIFSVVSLVAGFRCIKRFDIRVARNWEFYGVLAIIAFMFKLILAFLIGEIYAPFSIAMYFIRHHESKPNNAE